MALTAGSIAFVGYDADGTQRFAILAVDPLPAGTVIYFTDRRWLGSSFEANGPGSSAPQEGTLTWTVPSGGISCGTLVSFDNVSSGSLTVSAERNGATVPAGSASRTGSFDLEQANEVIYAYTGAINAPTTFVAAVANDGFTTANGALTGTGLTAGSTAVNLGAVDADADFGVYQPLVGGSTFTTRTAMLNAVNNPSNWIVLDTSADDSSAYVPFLTNTNSPINNTSFTISVPPPVFVPGDEHGGPDFTILPSEIGNSETFTFTALPGLSVKVTFDGTNIDLTDLPATETSPGVYQVTLDPSQIANLVTPPSGTVTITATASQGCFVSPPSTPFVITIVPCFLPGTRIATPAGEAAVETLTPGDLVLTADGRAVPVRFLGRRTVMPRFTGAERSNPIRIRAGALAENVPARDLFVSPNHAILVDGVLAFASALANGTTIAQVPGPGPRFVYYSVETEAHEVILAEGCPAETFMDHVPRAAWDNYADYLALHPEEPQIPESDLPHAKSHRQVPREVHARIAARAALLAGERAIAA
jgi:hypothetical protein